MVVVGYPGVTDAGNGGPWEWRPLGIANRNHLPKQQKINETNGAHLASPIRGELGYAHWPQLGTQFIALLGTKFGPIRERKCLP